MTTQITNYITTAGLAPALEAGEAAEAADQLSQLTGLAVYPASITAAEGALYFLGQRGDLKFLGVVTPEAATPFEGQNNEIAIEGQAFHLTLGPTTAANAAALRDRLPFLVARPLGLKKSAGCGDRLGLATPGHVRAIRHSAMAPIFAQQSMRENARTGRTPQGVMDDAMWGVFQEGWRGGFGADADHLKTTQDIDICAAAGYTFYTIDPGEYVDDRANTAPVETLRAMVADLPWVILDSSPADLQARLADQAIDLGDFTVTLSEAELLRAAAKYGRAVAHTTAMYRHLAEVMGDRPFELEMSVDETETITSLAEHLYIVNELRRLDVQWVSLAPRYVGAFEKGVDYIGDLSAFEASFAQHVAVARTFGPYKLSLHSGSDKFSVYPIAAQQAGDLVHLKTAGTSYLEALRAVAQIDPGLFRQIVAFARERYDADRATYHVSAELAKMPDAAGLSDDRLVELLEDFHSREVLHVTFGSVLTRVDFYQPFMAALRQNEETYYQVLETHFNRHFTPFS